jgi:hypothetical protein
VKLEQDGFGKFWQVEDIVASNKTAIMSYLKLATDEYT